MNKPANYDNTVAVTGDYISLPAGGYICEIKNAKVESSKSGKEMLVLALDIIDGEFKDYFAERYAANTAPDKKWPCVFRQLTEGESTKFFKGLITAIEDSNSIAFNFDESTLKGNKLGMLFGREEYEYNGDYRFSTKPVSPRSIQKIKDGDFQIPKDKELERKETFTIPTSSDDLVDDLPWD